MAFLRNLGKAVKIGVTSYITGGIAYWLTAEVYLQYAGRGRVFNPLVSLMLVVPFWPWEILGDLRWFGVLPQDVTALLVTIFTIILTILVLARARDAYIYFKRAVKNG